RRRRTERCRRVVIRSSYQISQRGAQLPRGSEQTVARGFLGSPGDLTDLPQPQSLVVAHLEDEALARREIAERRPEAYLDLAVVEASLGIAHRPLLLHGVVAVDEAVGRLEHGRHLGADLAAAQ